jgi:nitroreductase
MNYPVETINELIRSRRSIYPNMFTSEKVDDKIIHQMLENANWAPTHKLTEPWRFTVFSGKGLNKLAAFQAELYRKVTEDEGTFKASDFQKLLEKPLSASHVIAIGMKRDEKERLAEIEEIEAVACAVQNMYLTAAAYGLGAYWGSGGITYFEEAKSFFGLGEKDRLLGFFFVGIPKFLPPSGKRKPVEDKITWISE